MRARLSIPFMAPSGLVRVLLIVAALAASIAEARAQASQTTGPVVLDSVVAVVNRQPILASELDEEMRLFVLDPGRAGRQSLTRQRALELLISRTLIQQQIRREDLPAAQPTPDEISSRLAEMRKELPACVHQNCSTETGWKTFLAAHDLTPDRVDAYFRMRIEILRFIEQRFRPGIRISQQDIENYYRDTLLPQYSPGETVPPLERVSPRIEEVLLQQQVTVLFDEWLTNLRKQGDVEVLDPSLETPQTQSNSQNSSAGDEGAGNQ